MLVGVLAYVVSCKALSLHRVDVVSAFVQQLVGVPVSLDGVSDLRCIVAVAPLFRLVLVPEQLVDLLFRSPILVTLMGNQVCGIQLVV